MHPVPCELDTLVLDTYEKYEALMQEHHMNFSVELPDEEFPLCSCDPERISQVLGILLDNAISYVSTERTLHEITDSILDLDCVLPVRLLLSTTVLLPSRILREAALLSRLSCRHLIFYLFTAQRIDRIQIGCFYRRKQSKYNTDHCRKQYSDYDRRYTDRRR